MDAIMARSTFLMLILLSQIIQNNCHTGFASAFSPVKKSRTVTFPGARESRPLLLSGSAEDIEVSSSSGTSTVSPDSIFETRKLASIQKYARLPVWPAWNGAALFILSKLGLSPRTVAKLEDFFGGRVCPNFFNEASPGSASMTTSPFIMLVHHMHSFTSFDPLRYFQQKVILPEGFPSHPHRGFITLTYCLRGGMVHRDSMGLKQLYGAEIRHGGNIAQWLVAGAGMLHEEMWDVNHKEDGIASKQELFQIWINLPSEWKMTSPTVNLLNTSEESINDDVSLPIPIVKNEGVETIVLVGEYNLQKSEVDTKSPMSILHVRMEPGTSWSWRDLPKSYKTGIIYMRQGSASVPTETSTMQEIPTHHTATLTPYGEHLNLHAHSEDGADFMLLIGAPLYEPVEARGSMVMNSLEEIEMAYNDYGRGKMGLPWDQNFEDGEWLEHVRQHPNIYR
mmetsp:Transcript_18739/g.28465  ORF Transcript_18739/g.28465 Transcript_18739/m.28465 type:complete len:451 (-) Transcript_18739:89-1441(-)